MNFIRKSAFSAATCLQGATLAAALMTFGGATAAHAQDAASTAPADSAQCVDDNSNGICDKDEKGEIIVTGSHLTRPTLSSPVPLTSVSTSELTDKGSVSLGDALNDLPSLRSTFSSGNSTRFIGTAGLNILDLRGLGTARTLVLVNGKRHITSRPGQYAVDVNTIPVDLLERVDVVTGGNSAIYGSDAVAGVVNFVLKRDFDGISLRGQGGISSHHDRGAYFVSGTFGRNFADGRGNIAISAEYARQEPVYFRDRDDITGAFSGRCQFNTIEPTGGEPNGTDNIFDQAFVCGVRNSAISDGGTLGAIDASSNPTRRYVRFASDGSVFIDTPTLSFAPAGSGNQIGGQGSTLRNTGMMFAGVERYDANVLFHYDFSDALQFYWEGKYVHVWANQEGQPSFWQGSLKTAFGNSVAERAKISELQCSNGFITPAALATMQSFGLCSNVATGTFTMSRFNIDFGGRGEVHKRDTYRVVGGLRGTFNDDWTYDLSVNYGRFDSHQRSINNLKLWDLNRQNPDGFLIAADAVVAPVGYTGTNFVLNSSGQKVICRVNSVTNTRPDCVPVNVFGYGAPSAAALAFVNTTATREEHAEEFDVNLTVAGDTSQAFSLPGGPIGFAFGGEYREELARSAWDPLTASGSTFLNALQPFNPPKLTVKEAFGEIDLPLLKDMPLAKELTVRGAGRVSDYNSSAGTVWAWNIDGIYAPVDDVRFRVAYATSVRAPTQLDLFGALNQNFASITDPCDSGAITGNPNRAANCAAAGVPTTYNAATVAECAGTAFPGAIGAPFVNCLARSQTISFQSGGNANLANEKGKSFTVGMVLEPRWIPGLNITVDYYRIEVKNLIASPSLGLLMSLCFDSATPFASNPYCSSIPTDPNGVLPRAGSGSGLFGQYAGVTTGVNFAKQKTEGIDIDVSYKHTFGNGDKLSMRAIATRVMLLDNYTDLTNPTVPDRQLGELGDPLWSANASLNYDFGPVDFTYTARYIGKQTIGLWEDQNRYTGICPANGLTGFSGRTCVAGKLAVLDPQNNDLTKEVFYPGVIYHNVRLNFSVDNNKYNFYIGVDNLMDKKPPYGLLGTAGGDPYDTIGRFMYAGFKASW
ncbi:MAG: TonB-dependent receptor domain-containing protein [Novosphingobium sp.]